MANIKRNFIQGIMNKSLDERLVPNGQYVDALNIRLGSTEDSEIGSVELAKGNTQLSQLEYNGTALSSNAKCIGACEDSSRETIYWFVHDPSFTVGSTGKLDLIVSLDVKDDILTYHVISIDDGGGANTTLNFNPTYLITGVDFVGTELLYFTDDYNAPRYINSRKNYANPSGNIDQFSAEELLVIKKPPLTSPSITLQTIDGQENYIEQRFICFAYRYKYADNQYSAISQFSEAAFSPDSFSFEQASYLNEGMENSKNSVDISFNSGGPLVKGIDLLFKESSNSVIKVIRKFSKSDDGIADNTTVVESFDSNQIFTVLPESEILRTFDNVPLFAKAQTFMGSRIIYGNYKEGYDLQDLNNNPLRLQYDSEIVSTNNEITALPTQLSNITWNIDGAELVTNGRLTIDFSGQELKAGNVIEIDFDIVHNSFSNTASPTDIPTQNSGTKFVSFSYVLPSDFDNINDLATSTDFVSRVGTALNIKPVYDAVNPTSCSGTTFTDNYNCVIPETLTGNGAPVATWTKYASGRTADAQPLLVVSSVGNDEIYFDTLWMRWVDAPAGPTLNAYEYYSISVPSVILRTSQSSLSLHSNRNYEIGIIYMDDFNRPTTALTSTQSTSLYIPCGSSQFKNQIKVTIPPQQRAPSFATRYKFCIKPDVEEYNTIFSNIYFLDPITSHTYFLIEGENSRKVEEGDRLIVKRDSTGVVGSCSYATVLEKKAQAEGFIEPVDTPSGATVVVPSGTYMKILAQDFIASIDEDDFILPGTYTTEEKGFLDYAYQSYHGLSGGTGSTAQNPGSPPYALSIPAGSQIKVSIEFDREGSNVFLVKGSNGIIEANFISPENYDDILEWFNDNDIEAAFEAAFVSEGDGYFAPQTLVRQADNTALTESEDNVQYMWVRAGAAGASQIQFVTRGIRSYGSGKRKSTTTVRWEIIRADNTIVFESTPADAQPDLWYESSESYAIDQSTGYHQGSDGVYQTSTTPAIVNTAFGNCYSFGNGVESYKILDSLIGKPLALGERFFSTSAEEYKQSHRFADLTYSGVFNDETNVNKLNEFNLGLANFKTLEDSFGAVQLIDGRETDVLVLQEDKISYVLAGKNLLSDSTGGGAVASVPEVLGTQIARVEKYGISENPESYVQWGYSKFFTDAKRGAVIQLTGQGQAEQLSVVSESGMRSWFRDLFIGSGGTQKLGAFDPYMNEYVLSSNITNLPVEEQVQNCGVTRRLTVSAATPLSFTVNVGNTVGTCDIDYNIVSFSDSGSITISEDYTGTSTNINTIGAGTLVFAKDSVSDDDVVITLAPASSPPGGKQVVVLDVTVECPQAQEITLIEFCVSKDNQAEKTIHNEYQWTDGSFTSALKSKQVIFPSGDRNLLTPEIADYTTIVAPQGGSIIPNDGDTLTIRSVKKKGDTYDFDFTAPPNRLMFCRSNTLHPGTAAGYGLLLADPNLQVLTVTTPTLGTVEGDITIPSSTDQYMYIIYDYFS